jgi:hypothetical protein
MQTQTFGSQLYEDRWGAIIDRPAAAYLEVRWYDTTAEMSAAEFESWLSLFAEKCGRMRRPGVLIDSTNFRMDPANLNWEWRDATITPQYNAAGVKKFAFHMPPGMPAIGQPPAPDGRADFPTAFFGRRQDALNWLSA